ncbi:hypothetical protein H5410_026586 [Solanum commersonii]|uniref:Uncharacterized protein n=1 Tax=Solanum commersonii TaxID=4109 RepID=A0A9J5Z1Y3_SOLCO|nr:hypothetical protein H5410_026586 [Solanum commersonii]
MEKHIQFSKFKFLRRNKNFLNKYQDDPNTIVILKMRRNVLQCTNKLQDLLDKIMFSLQKFISTIPLKTFLMDKENQMSKYLCQKYPMILPEPVLSEISKCFVRSLSYRIGTGLDRIGTGSYRIIVYR